MSSTTLRPRVQRPVLRSAVTNPNVGFAFPAACLVVGIALWMVSLHSVAQVAGGYQPLWLAQGLPWTWFAALGTILAGAVSCVWSDRPVSYLACALLIGLVLVLYGTIPAIVHVPQYGWTYKHVGVTRSILAHGAVSTQGDIYDRWPGTFALAAAFARVTGSDPMSFAAWFEPVFTLLDALVISAIATTVTRSRRVALLTPVVWTCANWLGQDYFSPQGFAFLLSLVMLLVALKWLLPSAYARGRAARLLARRLEPELNGAQPNRRGIAIGAIVLLDAAIVASHQLTPYMIVVEFAVLTVLGLTPRWLVGLLALLAIAYLAPNLGYMAKHYGILASLNPANNVQLTTGVTNTPPWLASHAGKFLTAILGGLAVYGTFTVGRTGGRSRLVTLWGLAIAPFLFLAGSNYGGEGILRVVLFGSPWLCLIACWGLAEMPRGSGFVLTLTSTAALSVLFVFAFAGFSAGSVLPEGEVAASQYYYSHAPLGSVLMVAGNDFPTNLAANYEAFAGQIGDSSPSLLQDRRLHGHVLGASDIPEVLRYMRGVSKSGFLVFSKTQYVSARFDHDIDPDSLGSLESAVWRSADFRLWFVNSVTRIYRATPSIG